MDLKRTTNNRHISTPLLSRLYVLPTDQCNMRCLHCYRPHNPSKHELTRTQIERLFDECVKEGITRQVTFTGGEPLLKAHFWELVQGAIDHGLIVDVSTNALRITEEDMEALSELDIQYLQISIDGATRETYEAIRGKNTFDKVIANLEQLQRLKLHERIDLNMIVCVTPFNYREINQLVEVAERFCFSKIALGEVMPVGPNRKHYPRLALRKDQLEHVYEQISEVRANPVGLTRILSQFYFGWLFDEQFRPNVCTLSSGDVATIGPTGEVYLCPYFYGAEFVLGNIRETPLTAILSGEHAKRIRESYQIPEMRCEHWAKCGGGCPVLAKQFSTGGCDPRCPIS